MTKDIAIKAIKTLFQSFIAAGIIVYTGDDIGAAETPMIAVLAALISLAMNYIKKEVDKAKKGPDEDGKL